MTAINVEFAEDVFAALRKSPQEVERDVRLAAAMVWYARGVISQNKAAQIAGVSRAELIDALATSRIPVIQVTPEDLEAEVSRA